MLTPTAQIVRPVGRIVEIGGRPVDLALSPDGNTAYVKDNRGLLLIDVAQGKLLQELPFPSGGGSMAGIALSPNQKRLYLTTAQDLLFEATLVDGRASWGRSLRIPGPNGGASHLVGVAVRQDGERAWVCASRSNSVVEVDLKSFSVLRTIPVGVAPFDVKLLRDGATLCVTNWGGSHPLPGDEAAMSSGSAVRVDAHGVASSGTVGWVDLAAGRQVAEVEVGLHPGDLELHPDGRRLLVANANSDTVTVLDVRDRRVLQQLRVATSDALRYAGASPNGLAVSSDGKTVAVALGGENAVIRCRFHAATGRLSIQDRFPTAWYPSAIALRQNRFVVVNTKGAGSRRVEPGAPKWGVKQFAGSVQIGSWSDRKLGGDTTLRDAARPADATVGGDPRIRHVVYIIKENRTYDQVFGDMAAGDGDPSLCIYGEDVTPNHHALARRFGLLDNYYCNGVVSADGHSWATEGNVTDHLERSFGGFTRSYTFGDDPLTYTRTGFIWDRVLDAGLTFRNYGEMDYAEPVPADSGFREIYRDFVSGSHRIAFRQNIGVTRLRRYSSRHYPGWNMKIPDVLRADVFLRELKEFERAGEFPNLTIIYLPSDHTSGLSPGAPTPRAQVADNDLALGRIVEGLSQSRFWERMCIFVNEDDPQDGFDHVDGHRSLCLVISPYSTGGVDSRFYNQTSVLGTTGELLGFPPATRFEALSPSLAPCLRGARNLTPFRALPNRVALDEMNLTPSRASNVERRWYSLSASLNFSRMDGADEDSLNRVLWHAARGRAPYPSTVAGSHGAGLARRGLRVDSPPTDEGNGDDR